MQHGSTDRSVHPPSVEGAKEPSSGQDGGSGPIQVALDRLVSYNPFVVSPWQGVDDPIDRADVARAIAERRLHSEFLPDFPSRPITTQEHVERIAFFVVEGWNDPIHIDVGVPALGHGVTWPIVDGNHRLAAAFYLKHESIAAEISGQIDYAEEILGVKI